MSLLIIKVIYYHLDQRISCLETEFCVEQFVGGWWKHASENKGFNMICEEVPGSTIT